MRQLNLLSGSSLWTVTQLIGFPSTGSLKTKNRRVLLAWCMWSLSCEHMRPGGYDYVTWGTWIRWLREAWLTWPGRTHRRWAPFVTCQVFSLTGAHLPQRSNCFRPTRFLLSGFLFCGMRLCSAKMAFSIGSKPVSEGPWQQRCIKKKKKHD